METTRTQAVPEACTPVGDAELLWALQRRGPMSADDLATAAAMSRTAVLRRLAWFAAEGLVERRPIRRGVGRPRYQYDVTVDATGRLDSRYAALAGSLFEAVVDVGGHELLARVFDARRRRATALLRGRFEARGVASEPLDVRVRELAGWHDEHGFAADTSESRGLRLRIHGCPILRIAMASPAACDAELRMIAEALDADVERESLIATGARRCIYRIEPRVRTRQEPTWRAAQMRVATDPVPAPPASDEAPPVWRREQMRPLEPRRRDVRASRWPPADPATTVVRRDPPE
jgi:DeoR family transcriptional regulator, suf operon transcriptional repressor